MRKRAVLRLLVNGVVRYSGQLVCLLSVGSLEGPESLGYFTLALALLTPLYALFSFGMRQLLLTYNGAAELSDYETLRIATSGSVFLFVCIFSVWAPPDFRGMLVVVGAFKTLESLFDVYQAELIKQENEPAVLRWGALLTAGQVSAFLAALMSGADVVGSLAVSYGVYGLSLILGVRPRVVANQGSRLSEQVGKPNKARTLSRLARAGWPLGLSLFLLSMLTALPQWLLGAGGSVVDVGRFAILAYSIVAMEIVLNALAQAWIGSARKLEARGVLTLSSTLATARTWTLITSPVFIGCLILISLLGPVVFGSAHQVHYREVAPLLLSGVLVPLIFASANTLLVKNCYRFSLLGSGLALLGGGLIGWALLEKDDFFSLGDAVICFTVGIVVRSFSNVVAVGWAASPRGANG